MSTELEIEINVLTLIFETLNNSQTCRIVDFIAHTIRHSS
jgi:hypothetical protein